MRIEPFGFRDAREILGDRLEQAQRREAARLAAAQREADRDGGVAWSGLGADPPPSARPHRELRREAQAAHDRAQDFAASPRGRFLAGLKTLEQLGYGGPAERARAAYARGFADPERSACPAEIGMALSALARLDRAEARAACVALSELLMVALNAAAE